MAASWTRSGVIGTCVVWLVVWGFTCGSDAQSGPSQQASREGGDSQPVQLMWGIADTMATVGRLFQYHIPSDAFKGSVDRYVVVEAGKDSLPKWLHFDGAQNVLRGYPAPRDAGQLYLEVFARGAGDSSAMDVFSVIVNPDTPSLSPSQPLTFRQSGLEAVRCKRHEPETVATILIDVDVDGLDAGRQVALVDRFLAHMGLGEGVVKMAPAAGALDDASALVTGVGDRKELQTAGVALSWLVGCGKVQQGHFAVLQKLDDESSSGAMAQAVGHPVVGWRVTNSRLQQQHAVRRRRRQVRATATPVITIAPPTATTAGSTETDTLTHEIVHMTSPTFTVEPTPVEPVMPMTATTGQPPTITPKMVKPDVIQPSAAPPAAGDVEKTEVLPTDMATRVPSTTTTAKTTTTTTTMTPRPPPRPPKSTTTKTTPTTTTKKTTTTTAAMEECLKPDVNVEINRLNVNVGDLLEYRVPEETFTACGRGGTSSVKLTMFLNTSSRIPEDYWMQFDSKNQLIRGLPLESDVGRHSVTLVAMLPEQDYITSTSFKVHVRLASGKKAALTHELSMTFDTDYAAFARSLDSKLDLTRKVAGLYGEDNASSMTVTRISPGSVVYVWSNKTLAGNDCPVDDIKNVANRVINDDGTLSDEAVRRLSPWRLSQAAVQPLGECIDDPDFPQLSGRMGPPTSRPGAPEVATTHKPAMPTSSSMGPDVKPEKTMGPAASPTPGPNTTESVGKGSISSTDDIWITTVVPAVVIVAILVLALLIACILYRKKRKGKMNLEDQNTFVNKGAPVIFPDELDDKPGDSTKPLLLETPPAPPPEYSRGGSESPERRAGYKQPTPPTDEADADIEETSVTSPLYQPPPPVTSSSGKQARPHVQQPYKAQPPKIQP